MLRLSNPQELSSDGTILIKSCRIYSADSDQQSNEDHQKYIVSLSGVGACRADPPLKFGNVLL